MLLYTLTKQTYNTEGFNKKTTPVPTCPPNTPADPPDCKNATGWCDPNPEANARKFKCGAQKVNGIKIRKYLGTDTYCPGNLTYNTDTKYCD